MARKHQARFNGDMGPYDVAKEVCYELDAILPSIFDKATKGKIQ